MESFKKRQVTFLLQLVSAALFIFLVHSYVLHYFADKIDLFFPIWHIYAFHCSITYIFFTVINYRFSKGHKSIFNLFMIMTFLKMLLAIGFLLPLLLSDIENKQPDVFNFFIPYFLFLFLEVFAVTRFIQEA